MRTHTFPMAFLSGLLGAGCMAAIGMFVGPMSGPSPAKPLAGLQAPDGIAGAPLSKNLAAEADAHANEIADLNATILKLHTRLADAEAQLVALSAALKSAGGAGNATGHESGHEASHETGDGTAAPAMFDPAAIQRALGEMLANPDGKFKKLLRETMDAIDAERSAEAEAIKREKNKAAFMAMIGHRIAEIRETLGLSDAQIADIEALASDIVDERQAAEIAGASADELAAIDRKAQRGVRDIIGQAAYRDLRRDELSRTMRPMVGMALLAAGATDEQRQLADRYLDEHIDRVVADDIRLQTEDMPHADHQALRAQFDAANKQGWLHIRDTILTPEQRARVGGK